MCFSNRINWKKKNDNFIHVGNLFYKAFWRYFSSPFLILDCSLTYEWLHVTFLLKYDIVMIYCFYVKMEINKQMKWVMIKSPIYIFSHLLAKSSAHLATHQLGDANLLPFLPLDEDHHECRGTQGGTVKCGLAGDERAAEQPTLTALHTVFVRLHNNIVSELQLINGHWDEERLFNETRK